MFTHNINRGKHIYIPSPIAGNVNSMASGKTYVYTPWLVVGAAHATQACDTSHKRLGFER